MTTTPAIPVTLTPMTPRVKATLLAALRVFTDECGQSVEADDAKAYVLAQATTKEQGK